MKFVTYDLVRGDMLKGIVSKLGCKTFDGATNNQKIINCWAYTNENIIYLLKVDANISQDGELELKNIYRNFYNTGTEQYITGCVISDEFIVCSSDNLSVDIPNERTSILVFRIYNTTTRKDYYEYAKLTPKHLKNITPFISTLSFDGANTRILSDIIEEKNFISQQKKFLGKLRFLQQNKDFKAQNLSIYGVSSDGIKKYSFEVSPTAIMVENDNLAKTNPEDIKKIEIKVTGTDGKVTSFLLGSLNKDSKPDVIKPDDKSDKPEPPPASSSVSSKGSRLGVLGWSLIILFLIVLIGGAWWFVRREQLKVKNREKMIEGETPEMESYA